MIVQTERVRYVETDMMGVVHHSNYLRWFEVGRVAWLRAAGVDLWDLMNDGIVFPITKINIQYKNSAYYDDVIDICTTMTAFSKAKMEFSYKIVRQKDGKVLTEGSSCNVFTDKDGKIIRLTNAYFDKINELYKKEVEE